MNALHFSPNHSYIETVAHTYTFTNAQPSPAAISNEILKAFSVFLCHILNSAAVVAHHTTPHTHTQTLLNYHWWHRLAQMQTHITTQSYTIYSITLILFPSFTHTHTDGSCTHTGMHSRTYFFCPATKVLHKSNYRCFHDDLNHFLMQPLDAVVREEISFLNHLQFCLFIMDSSWCFSSLPLSPLTFHQRGNNQRLGKDKKKKTTCKLQKKRHRKGSARGEERQCFFKVCGFWLFSWPIEPHCALSPQTLRISNGCFLTQSKQIAWKRKSTNRWEGESGKGREGGGVGSGCR